MKKSQIPEMVGGLVSVCMTLVSGFGTGPTNNSVTSELIVS